MYATTWASIPEREGLPNNFRTAVSGRELTVNKIRWVHPTVLPEHAHTDAEQAVILMDGELELTIDGQVTHLSDGAVAIVPRGIAHSGKTIGSDAVFIEVFAPARSELMVGFLGQEIVSKP